MNKSIRTPRFPVLASVFLYRKVAPAYMKKVRLQDRNDAIK